MQIDQILDQFNSFCRLFLWEDFLYPRSITERTIFKDTLALYVLKQEPWITTHATSTTFHKFVTAVYHIIYNKSTRFEDFPIRDAVIVLRKSLQPDFVPPFVPRITTGGFGTPTHPRIHPLQPGFQSSVFHLL